jgi:hypothetical protein
VIVRINKINDKKVKLHTGFPSLLTLLGYVSVICGGNIDTIQSSSSTLTWFEEWYIFFQVVYGRSSPRWVDMADRYKVSEATIRKIYDKKIRMALAARQQWPKYVSMTEDDTYRKTDKWDAYIGKRVVMYDNTNVIMFQPLCADAQRATYSLYYSGNVGKGAVHIQPCG